MPGHIPPESCQPPPDPAIHSPKIALAATKRRSSSVKFSVNLSVCPVARIHKDISEANKLVETANLEPFGMLFTLLTISIPLPLPAIFSSR